MEPLFFIVVALAYVGAFIGLAGGLLLLVEILQDGVLWLLACLLVPFAQVVWIVTHWERARQPLLLFLYGGVMWGTGFLMMGYVERSGGW